MNTPGQQLIHLVLTLAKAGDLTSLPNLVDAKHLELAQELGALIEIYSYTESLAFELMVRGKSLSVVNTLRRKHSEPARRAVLVGQSYDHMRRMMSDGGAAQYLPTSAADRLTELRRKLKETATTLPLKGVDDIRLSLSAGPQPTMGHERTPTKVCFSEAFPRLREVALLISACYRYQAMPVTGGLSPDCGPSTR